MKKLMFLFLLSPIVSFAQGKFQGGDGSGYHSISITLPGEGPVLGIERFGQFIYPNPAYSTIRLKKVTVSMSKITDIQGRLIKLVPKNTETVEVGELRPGSYFLHLDGKVYRFIKY